MISQEDKGIYDVIIIGSGMGGLSAGNILVKKGYRVIIIEQIHIPGGYCVNFKRKDYTFDSSLHMLNGCEKGGMIYNILHKFDATNCVEFIKLKEIFHWQCPPRNIDIKFSSDFKKFVNQIQELFPKEAKNINRFYKDYGKVVKFMLGWNSKGILGKIFLFMHYFRTFFRFYKSLNQTVTDILDPYIKDPVCKNMITALGGFFGLGPDDMSASIFIAGTMAYYFGGAYYPKGGSGTFSKALADIFQKNGGRIIYNTEVTKIIFDDGKVEGVKIIGKNREENEMYSKVIIVNSDLTSLVSNLCPKNSLPDDYILKIKERRPGYSVVVVYLGLNLNLKKKGILDFELWRTDTVKSPNSQEIDDIAGNLEFSNLEGNSATIYSNIDPLCCPPEKSVISMLYYAKPNKFNEAIEKDGGKRGEHYKKLKQEIADIFIGKVSELLNIPNLRDYIEVLEVATPITMQRYTGNRNGSFIGWEMTPQQMMLNQVSQKTPIKNLFLAGGWTLPGGGVSAVMVSGDMCSKRVESYLKKHK